MQNTPATPANDANDEIDLLALLGALIDHKFTIIACTMVFAVAGIAYAMLTTPVLAAAFRAHQTSQWRPPCSLCAVMPGAVRLLMCFRLKYLLPTKMKS